MTDRRCRLLAVDVDGTLVFGDRMDEAGAEALRAAADAGVVVCLCTGRSWPEVRPVWHALRLPAPHAPVICVGGALVAEPATGRTLYSRAFDRRTAADLAGAICRLGYPVMALVDAWREGFDYFIVGDLNERREYRRFFRGRGLRLREVAGPDLTTGPRALRISLLADRRRADELVAALRRQFPGRIEIQRVHLPRYDVHIAEAFAAGTDKFTALVYVGQDRRIAPAAMAAIGDDHNDIPMLRRAGFSAAPADAPPEVRRAAAMTAPERGNAPVAWFVDAVLNGQT